MMSKYKEIHERFKSSGLSQKDFAAQEGISPSMVSYYVNRAKEETGTLNNFRPIQISKSNEVDGNVIHITTSNGVKISIPL